MNRSTTKEHHFAPFDGTLALQDLEYLKQLDTSKSSMVYDVGITLNTVWERGNLIQMWTQSNDGVVPLGNEILDLRKKRPEHWNIYLLEFNQQGLLVRRQSLRWADRHKEMLVPSTSGRTPLRGAMSPDRSLNTADGQVRSTSFNAGASGSCRQGRSRKLLWHFA